MQLNKLRAARTGLLLLLLTLPAVVQAQFTLATNNGTITITGYTGSGGAVTIPRTTNGYLVTGIGSSAFDNCASLTSITIGTNVTSIGAWAFSICTGLTAITVDTNSPAYSSVEGVLFNKNQTTLIQYPGGKAGASCTIPSSVTNIAGRAFGYCSSLIEVTIPNSVTSIGDNAFSECTKLATIAIPNSVPSIGGGEFVGCSCLTNVTIPNGVTSIGPYTFQSCASLTRVTIPSSVTSIGNLAFEYCTGLTAITVDTNSPACSSVDGVLFSKDQSTLLQYPEGKAGATYMIPTSVTSIGNYAFESCLSLTNVTLGTHLTSIGYAAFNHCYSLTSATIPDSVTDIAGWAFGYCTSLTSVSLPKSVTSIGSEVFDNCHSLAAITVDALNPSYSSVDGVLFNENRTTLIKYPEGKAGSDYAILTGVANIGSWAFYPRVQDGEAAPGPAAGPDAGRGHRIPVRRRGRR